MATIKITQHKTLEKLVMGMRKKATEFRMTKSKFSPTVYNTTLDTF